MEVLQLKCGVSVNKMVLNESNTDKQWVEVRNFCILKIKSPPPKKKKLYRYRYINTILRGEFQRKNDIFHS